MKVTEIQRFCMHDGDGVRTTVFLKGCPLSCLWCHNPEAASLSRDVLFYRRKCIFCMACADVCPNGAHLFENGEHIFDRKRCTGCMRCSEVCCSKALEPSFREMTVGEVVDVVMKDLAFYGEVGGITLSGGEPMMQADQVLELLDECKKQNITTAVETCGYFDSEYLESLAMLTDCFLWDFKLGDDEKHRKYTGVSNTKIKENLIRVDSLGADTVLRCIMIRGVNMDTEHYNAIADVWHSLKHCRYVELLPYHAYGASKMLLIGKEDNSNVDWIPDDAMLNEARAYLRKHGVKVREQNSAI